MATPWYPRNDEQLQAFMTVFLAALADVMTDLGLAATFDDALVAANTAFNSGLGTHQSSQAQAQTDRYAKDTAKDALIAELTKVVFQLRPNPAFTEEHATSLQIPVYDTTPTPVVAGSEVPTLEIDTSAPQHHRVLFWQMTDEGTLARAKPSWARACRITHKIVATGQPAPPIEDVDYLATDTSTPYTWDIPGAHVGKDIWYRLAWETSRGGIGPWSDPAKGTVTG